MDDQAMAQPSPMNPRELRQIGPYPVEDFIAEGGMAWVFKVLDPRFKVHRALKMLKPQAAQGDEFRRFETEAKLLARVEHPNLITIYDLGRDEATECHYYTMTLVDGATLGSAQLDVAEAIDVFAEVLSALGRLHEQGIIHRDIKPGNILRMSDGRVLLGDLGIARQKDQLISLTRTGMAIGSVQYMSPEQARGDVVTPASDIFSMGLTLYQVLTGHTIYDAVDEVDATSGEQVLMYLGALIHSGSELRFSFPPQVPAPLRRVIEKACRFDPSKRYADANEMRQALIAAASESERAGERRARSRRRLLGVLLVLLALGGATWLWASPGQRDGRLTPYHQEELERMQAPTATEAGKLLLIQQLRDDPNAQATDVLMAASADPSVRVSVEAIKQLGRRVDDRVAAHLVHLLDDPTFNVRASAARALGDAGREDALPALEARLKVEDQDAVQYWLRRSIDRIRAGQAGGK
jgi:serine/threonine protein kinase